ELRYVDAAHRQVVAVPPPEYGAVGFDGRFDAAAFVVPPSVVARMSVPPGKAAQAGWHVEQRDGWSHRVLWSEAQAIALRVESQRSDGSFTRRITVELTAPAAAPPWHGAGDYR